MAIARHYQTDVSTTAVAIEGTQYPGWILYNAGTDDVFLGGDNTVTAASGFPVHAGSYFSPSEKNHESLVGKVVDRLWGIAAASRDIRVIVPGKDLNR